MTESKIYARQALLAGGWANEVTILIGADGRIAGIETGIQKGEGADIRVDILLPAMPNLHSHSFQRAMAGLTETRSDKSGDNFWSWRQVMYGFLEALTPDDIEAIAAQVQMEMLEAGYASIGEFHYIHHGPDGEPYDNPAELSLRQFAAAAQTGIGYTHLPVLYQQGGLDHRPLQGGQLRFGCDLDRFERLYAAFQAEFRTLPEDHVLGVAPHSLRAVTADGLDLCGRLASNSPVHIHIAEQVAELEEVQAARGTTPVDWLLSNASVDERWCLVHATHMTEAETKNMARSGAIAGLCPITEANLGDGIFDGPEFISAGGKIGIGSDSNVRISLTEELRLLEYSQRFARRARAVLTGENYRSNGRFLYEASCRGGAQAMGRDCGRIEIGDWADLTVLDGSDIALQGRASDDILDAWIFTSDDHVVKHVWSAGRHVVKNGRHIARDDIEPRFAKTLARLRGVL